jgi:hypothetical protein
VSAQNPASFTEFLANLPIPWLVGGTNGSNDAAAQGAVLDQQVSLIKQATKAHMPGQAPTDALPVIGGDRQLEQGPTETNANFITRLKTAWDDWARAGTALELLVQLYWAGFGSAAIIQQNGLVFTLSAAPTAGQDPTSLLQTQFAMMNPNVAGAPRNPIAITISTGGTLGTMAFKWSYNGGAQSAPVTSTSGSFIFTIPGSYTRVIFSAGTYVLNSTYAIAGDGTFTLGGGAINTVTQNSTPFWTYDGRDYFNSRFVVLFPTTLPASFSTMVSAVFNGSQDYVDVTWPWAFSDATYQIGFTTTTTDGTSPIVYIPISSVTPLGVRVATSARFSGQVDLIAWELGTNPYADPHADALARIRRIISRWKPAKATCLGIIAGVELPLWGWPTTTTWGQGGLKWGPSIAVRFSA